MFSRKNAVQIFPLYFFPFSSLSPAHTSCRSCTCCCCCCCLGLYAVSSLEEAWCPPPIRDRLQSTLSRTAKPEEESITLFRIFNKYLPETESNISEDQKGPGYQSLKPNAQVKHAEVFNYFPLNFMEWCTEGLYLLLLLLKMECYCSVISSLKRFIINP